MTDKTTGMTPSDHGRRLHDGFRERLPHRQHVSGNDVTDAIKARMAAAKSAVMPPAYAQDSAPAMTPVEVIAAQHSDPALDTPQFEAPQPPDHPPQPLHQSQEFETDDGFQIFKNRSVPPKPVLPEAPAFNPEADQAATAEVEPVPMAPDAIEDALKLIEAEDERNTDDGSDTAEQEPAIGFTPSNLRGDAPESQPFPIGNFGAFDQPDTSSLDGASLDEAPSDGTPLDGTPLNGTPAQNALHNDGPNGAPNDTDYIPLDGADNDQGASQASRDEIDIAAALSAEFALPDPVASPANDVAVPDLQVVDDNQRRNMEIGKSMANSIKSIIKDEVDSTLDRIARQAVRDALKAHRTR